MSWYCLRMHARYRCRHAGACCRADWEISAEAHVLSAVDGSPLRRSAAGRALMAELTGAVEVMVPRGPDHACLFFEPAQAGSCAIHRRAGEDALPSACRHFPREVVITPRGTFVSLSHFCPTAAALLTSPGALDVVAAEPPLRIGGAIEGLDATEALPPLLRPGMLGDLDGYAAWESAGLAMLAQREATASEALAAIGALTEAVRTWSPGAGPLRAAVAEARRRVISGSRPILSPRVFANQFAALIAQHVPEESFPVAGYESTWEPLVEGSPEVELVMKNYLAARLFANWIGYQGQGFRTIVEWLRTCHAVMRNEIALRCMPDHRRATVDDALAAAGRADLLMVHTVDSQAFARFCADAERSR